MTLHVVDPFVAEPAWVTHASYASTSAVATLTGHGRRSRTSRAVFSAASRSLSDSRWAWAFRCSASSRVTRSSWALRAWAYDAWARFIASATRPRRER